MKKALFVIFAICFALFFLLFSSISGIPAEMPKEAIHIKTASGEQKFIVEIATTGQQQEQGLMGRTALADDAGMLFIFPDEREIKMWMKNTLIPLDMLFIDSHGKIIYIARNTAPNSLNIISAGTAKSRAVLEIKGGTAKKQQIEIGDIVLHKVFE